MADPAIYRLFLAHVAVFEREARSDQASDKSGDAFRNHIKNQFGLTSNEYLRIAGVALDFDNQLARLKSRSKPSQLSFATKSSPKSWLGLFHLSHPSSERSITK